MYTKNMNSYKKIAKLCIKSAKMYKTTVYIKYNIVEQVLTEVVSVYDLGWRLRRFKLSGRNPV
jgi:hypothetical protein